MTPAPCFDPGTHTDCPNRHVGCREACEAWKRYEAVHEAEKKAYRERLYFDNEWVGFCADRRKRFDNVSHIKSSEKRRRGIR